MDDLNNLSENDDVEFETNASGLGRAVNVSGSVLSVESESDDGAFLGPYRKVTVKVMGDDGDRYALSQYKTEDGLGSIDVTMESGMSVGGLNCGSTDKLSA